MIRQPTAKELDLLKWLAMSAVGLYMFRKFQAQNQLGAASFDTDAFVEEGASLIPHQIAQNPRIKKLAKDILDAKLHSSYRNS